MNLHLSRFETQLLLSTIPSILGLISVFHIVQTTSLFHKYNDTIVPIESPSRVSFAEESSPAALIKVVADGTSSLSADGIFWTSLLVFALPLSIWGIIAQVGKDAEDRGETLPWPPPELKHGHWYPSLAGLSMIAAQIALIISSVQNASSMTVDFTRLPTEKGCYGDDCTMKLPLFGATSAKFFTMEGWACQVSTVGIGDDDIRKVLVRGCQGAVVAKWALAFAIFFNGVIVLSAFRKEWFEVDLDIPLRSWRKYSRLRHHYDHDDDS